MAARSVSDGYYRSKTISVSDSFWEMICQMETNRKRELYPVAYAPGCHFLIELVALRSRLLFLRNIFRRKYLCPLLTLRAPV